MKFKDYYEVLGVARDATEAEIKKAYRKLAHRFHPDVSSDPDGEERFKEAAEAYATLKDTGKRAAYDQLGSHRPGEDVEPPSGWRQTFGDETFGQGGRFEDVDLSDLFAAFGRGGAGQRQPARGQDFEVAAPVTLEQVHDGAEIDIDLAIPEVGDDGLPRRANRTFRVRIPTGAADGQRLRLAAKGAPSPNGGRPGDLYLVLAVQPHPVFRVNGKDLYLDLALAPWEAVLGARVEVPTLGGAVEMNVPPGTAAGRKLRLSKRGLGDGEDTAGDLYAVVRIEVPVAPTVRERELFTELGKVSSFDARARAPTGGGS